MKIYLVRRTDRINYDEYDSWVVRAESPRKAKELCKDWGDAEPTMSQLKVGEIKTTGKAECIHGSFNAG